MPILVSFALIKRIQFVVAMLTFVVNITAAANGDYESAGFLIRQGSLSVELLYKLANNCNAKSAFALAVQGAPSDRNSFLNWQFSYFNCAGSITVETRSFNLASFNEEAAGNFIEDFDYTFNGKRLYKAFFGVTVSDQPVTTLPYDIPIPISKAPSKISGPSTIIYGEQALLKVAGGQLGDPTSKWKWYSNACGKIAVGEGEKIEVSPDESTTYFVRGEGMHGSTPCVSIRIVVDPKSRRADSIAGKTYVCTTSGSTTLSPYGGKLGRDAQWIWYADSIGVKPIGIGAHLEVQPKHTTRYYLRAESKYNITTAASILVRTVDTKSTAPNGIKAPSKVCEGDNTSFSVIGGTLSPEARLVWYEEEIAGDKIVGTGNTLLIEASYSSTYLVRAEGACNITNAVSAKIEVATRSQAAAGILKPADAVYRGQKLHLKVQGGKLGEHAKWAWYNSRGRKIGTGNVISIRPRITKSYSVRAVSECSITDAVSTEVYVKRRFVFFNLGIIPSFNASNAKLSGDNLFSSAYNKAINDANFALTIGSVKRSGWYLRAKYSFNTEKAEYETTNEALIDFNSTDTYYEFDGRTHERRLGATLGALLNLSPKTFLLGLSAGYGERTLNWAITKHSYQSGKKIGSSFARNVNHSVAGVEGEVNVFMKLPVLNLMIGGNIIVPTSKSEYPDAITHFIDAYIGVGLNF